MYSIQISHNLIPEFKETGYHMMLHSKHMMRCMAVLWIPKNTNYAIEFCIYNVRFRANINRQQAAKILREWRAMCRENRKVRT